MSFNKHRHGEYTSKSRHHFQNSISKIGGSAARDAYFAPKHRQKSPEFGGSAAGAYSGYSEQETESEIDDFRSVRCDERNYDKELYNSRSKHDYHHYKEYSPERSSRVYQHPRKGSCEEYHSSQRSLHTTSRKSHTSKKSSNYRCHPHSKHHNRSRDSSSENEDCYNRTSSRTTDRNETSRRNDTYYNRSSHRSPSKCLSRKSHLRHDYRWRTKRTPSESPTSESRHSHSHTKYHSSSHHSRTGERHEESRQFHSRHGDHAYSFTYRRREHYRPTSSSCSSSSDSESSSCHSGHNESYHSRSRTDKRSSVRHKSRHRSHRQHTKTSSSYQSPPRSGCCSSSDNESSASSPEYSSDDKYSSHLCYDDRVCSTVNSSSSDRRYYNQYDKRHHHHEKHLSPERSYHHQDRQIYQIKSLSMAETNSCKRDNLAEDSLPMHASEDQNENRARSTRMLKVEQDPPFTNAFQQEFRQKFDPIECMARLILSRTRTPPRIGFHSQPLNWRGLFL